MKIEPKYLYMSLPVGLLLMSVSIQVTAAVVASRGNDAEIERDYYERGLNWDEYQKLVAASQRLGWQVTIEPDELLGPGAPVGVLFKVDGPDGSPIEGIEGSVEAFQNAHVDETHHLELEELAPGYYRGTMNPLRTGRWVWRLDLKRGDEVFVGEERAELFAAPEAAR